MHLINAMYTKGMSKGDGGYKEPFICFIPVFSKSRSPLFKKKKKSEKGIIAIKSLENSLRF